MAVSFFTPSERRQLQQTSYICCLRSSVREAPVGFTPFATVYSTLGTGFCWSSCEPGFHWDKISLRDDGIKPSWSVLTGMMWQPSGRSCTTQIILHPFKNLAAPHTYTTASFNKKLIRRWDSERELFYDDIIHALKNTIDSCINSATDRFLQSRFTKFSEITQCNCHYAV